MSAGNGNRLSLPRVEEWEAKVRGFVSDLTGPVTLHFKHGRLRKVQYGINDSLDERPTERADSE